MAFEAQHELCNHVLYTMTNKVYLDNLILKEYIMEELSETLFISKHVRFNSTKSKLQIFISSESSAGWWFYLALGSGLWITNRRKVREMISLPTT